MIGIEILVGLADSFFCFVMAYCLFCFTSVDMLILNTAYIGVS